MRWVLALYFIIMLLPSGYIREISLVEAISNIKYGFGLLQTGDIALPLLLLPLLYYRKETGDFFYRFTKLSIGWMMFVGWAILLTLLSFLNPEIPAAATWLGLGKLGKFCAYSLISVAVYHCIYDYQDLKLLTKVFYLGTVSIAVIIIIKAPEVIETTYLLKTHVGIIKTELLYHGNQASVALATALCFMMPILKSKFYSLVYYALIVIAILLTTGRGGYAGAFLGLIYVASIKRNYKLVLNLIIIGAIAVLISQISYISESVNTLLGRSAASNPDLWIFDTGGRMDVYNYFFKEILPNKLIMGSGFGIWGEGTDLPEWTMHNFLFQMWAELGFPGMVLVVYCFWRIFKITQNSKRYDWIKRNDYSLGLQGALVAVLIGSLTETYLYGGIVLGIFCYSLGLTLANIRLQKFYLRHKGN